MQDVKRLKTLQLRETAVVPPPKKQTAAALPQMPSTTTTTVTVHAAEDEVTAVDDATMAHDGSPEVAAASERRLNSVNAAKVQMMKAALFDDEMAEEGETGRQFNGIKIAWLIFRNFLGCFSLPFWTLYDNSSWHIS